MEHLIHYVKFEIRTALFYVINIKLYYVIIILCKSYFQQ